MISKEDKKIYKTTIIMALPIIFQELINSSVNLLDTFMVGSLGLNSVTAVGSANQIFFLFALLVFGISSGSSAFMGQYWGNNEKHNLHKTMGICLVFSLIIATAFFIPSQLFGKALIDIYSDNENVIELGAKYLKISSISFFLTAIIVTINTSLKSTGQTKLPMFTTLIALTTNAILNYIFIYTLKKGVEGAAIATLIARMLEVSVQIFLIKKMRMPVYTKFKNYFSFTLEFVKKYIKIVWSVFANEALWALGTTSYFIAYSKVSNEAVGAIQISSSVQQMFMVVGMGVGSASGIIIANLLGSGERDKAIDVAKKATHLSVILSILMSIVLLLTAPLIVRNFDVPDVVKNYTYSIFYIISVGMVVKTYNFTAIVGILRNGGDTLFCLLIDFVSVWFVGVPLAFISAVYLKLPIYFVFGFVYSEELVKFLFCYFRIKSNKWANRIIEE